MSKITFNRLKEHIEKEGLKLLKENQPSNLENTIEDLDAGLIQLYEKKFDKLKSDEEKAIEKEEYPELKRIKQEQVEVIRKLIKFYEKKVEYLTRLGSTIETGANEVGTKGASVFSNKALDEFRNEEFLKGNKVKISGGGRDFVVEKVTDTNVYKVITSNIEGIQSGDMLKLSDMKIGGGGNVTVYRKIGERFEELKQMKFNNVTEIIKNPS